MKKSSDQVSVVRAQSIYAVKTYKLAAPASMPIQQILLSMSFAGLLIFIVISCSLLAAPWLAGVGLAIVAVATLAVKRPAVAIVLVFLCTDLPSLLLHTPGHTIRLTELMLLLCLSVILLLRPAIRLQFPHVLALLFFAIAFISFVHVPEFITNIAVFGANKRLYNLAIILLAFFCGTFLFPFIRDLSSFFTLVLLSNLPIYLICIAQAMGVPLPAVIVPNQNPAATGDKGRLVGPFDGAATLGLYMTGLFALSLTCWLHGKRLHERLLGALMTFLSLGVVVGSGTRSALAALGAMLCIALILTRRYRLCWIFALASIGGLLAFPGIIIAHFTHASTSTTNRIFLWHEASKLILSHPILGIGLEQFHYYYQRLTISQATQLNAHGISVHNQYLEWALEGGIPWLIVGLLFILSLLVLCGRAYRKASPAYRIPLLATILLICATLITGCLDVPFDIVENATFFCLVSGIAMGSVGQMSHQHSALRNTGEKENSKLCV
ncbi:O-antigen ligase family protein [Dictyobacter formicarum]|uniref:O-antigen ligase-related domain-containing protein n=1 Tax=Dictyobacter formicarum TaxID=2778368 RepID=A0ABQ3V7L7_9CHLR|nr:O-antigen ligase family protein [Dictyobacter formicarum]GHO82122.1 hypothetical protein KSZ_01280 [Dictyobacter formicarum]